MRSSYRPFCGFSWSSRMRTYSSGSGSFHNAGAIQSPISPPPMKTVTNSNREPFHVKRYGHDEGLRSSSVTGSTDARAVVEAGASPWTIPEGQRRRTAQDPALAVPEAAAPPGPIRGGKGCEWAPPAALEPSPKITSAGATAGDADAVSI